MVKIATSKKTGKKYRILDEHITNYSKGKPETMVLYAALDELSLSRVNENLKFVCEKKDFFKNFKVEDK